ncbi:MAG: phosphoenolpyruvate carboxylase [Tepidamorphaceae bacterium]|nr:phosphoenolpyruvate carboxylase [Rhodobiaceae bacterium]MCC0049251.1 phosphoenolpyruvate carboxylase [Rhodobiaceae bacterium]
MNAPASLQERYLDLLEAHIAQPAHDPQANAVKQLAYDISRELEAGTVSTSDLDGLAKTLSDQALVARAGRLSAYMESGSSKEALARFDRMVRASAMGDGGKPVPFEAFCARWQRSAFGFVLTAHPTFSMSDKLRAIIAELATHEAGSPEYGAALEALKDEPHQPEAEQTLLREHVSAQSALKRMAAALDILHRQLVGIARDLYPLQWAAFRPELSTLASWVGYDLDGRSDIGWSDSIRFRLREKADQLEAYAARVGAIIEKGPDGKNVAKRLEKLKDKLERAAASAQAEAGAFQGDMADEKAFAAAANRLTDPDPDRILDTKDIRDELHELIIAETSEDARMELIVLHAAIATRGLGTGHIHMRINAVQVHNALRAHLGWTGQGALDGRLPLSNLTKEIAATKPSAINFASLENEQTTALRQMMLVARFLTCIDRDTVIRYLIAECEQPLTAVAVLYFARLFGVDDHIDISPLFETPDALERGNRLIEQLIENEAFRTHLERRGRIAIQTGFSDAGRFIGQIPASLAIERLQIQMARLIEKSGLKNVEALIFDTHGESLGRGSHPGSLTHRQHHIMTPWARSWFRRLSIPLKHESSFQGTDGFLLFETDDMALRSVSGILVAENSWTVNEKDPFYTDIAFTWDFYRALRSYQTALYNDPDYGSAVFAFAGNLLFATGSRKARRASESGGGRSDLSRLRAIPHNATLQQLGFLPNVVTGFGSAAVHEFDRFADLCRRSPRATALVKMIAFARRQSSLTAFAAQATILDAGFWIARADAGGPGPQRGACLTLAERLAENGTAFAFARFHNRLRTDLLHLEALLAELGSGVNPLADESRRALYLLHAVRIALMMHVMLRAADLPPFAARNDFSREVVLDLLIQMRVPEAVDLIAETFPRREDTGSSVPMHEKADFGSDRDSGYPHIHDHIIAPISNVYAMMRRIGIGLSHRFGAYG